MEENFRPDAPDRAAETAAAEEVGCRNELTRNNSNSSSITVDDSRHFGPRNTNARACMKWTDEKHSLYLDTLEASFVKQLHHSLGLRFWHSEQNTCDAGPSRQLPVNASYSSDEFTVLRDGSWQKIKFERNKPLPYSSAGSDAVMESLWIHHFRFFGKHSNIISADFRECGVFQSEGMPLGGKRIFSRGLSSLGRHCVCYKCHQDADSTTAEVSDQNFEDEDQEEKPSRLSCTKRLKMALTDASTADQIVSSGNIFTAETSSASDTLS